ncbi:MAG TPA: FAD-dependent oxidoreductase [Streptosporangiaceae bacterium]|nr:FAD-dependent oxidoreductase [Streptosporangiaceae bacterium]
MTELGLAGQGVAFIEPPVAADVRGELVIGRGGAGLGGAVQAMFASVSRACVPALYRAPEPEPSLVAGWRSSGEGAAADLADLTPAGLAALAALAAGEAGRLAVRYACAASGFFGPDERIGAVGGFTVARWFSPALVAGGSKNLANALFRLAASAGADCHVSARVTRAQRSGPGFALSCRDGRQIGARDVICTLDPRTTFTGLLDPDLVPASLAAAGRDWAVDDLACFTAHFGIAGLPPAFPSGGEPYLRLAGFRSVRDLDDHLAAVLGGRLPERPAGVLSITTAHDPLQASPGPYGPLHTLRFDTFAPLNHPDGPWDRQRRHYRARCWDFLCDQFQALREAHLIAQFADAPGDLRRRFAATGAGTVRQGALSPAQALTLRPHPSCADTRTPVPGFYLGGGGVHPGVPGLLGAGMLAARAVMADRGLADPVAARP